MTIDLIGKVVGNCRIEARLGVGGMGEVYRARHVNLDQPRALKVLHANLAGDPSFQARFRQEARDVAALDHANIIKVYDSGDQGGLLYLVMELMPDGSLRGVLEAREGSLALGVDLVRQAADGLAYAHAQGVVHRDIKPDNLLLIRQTDASGAAIGYTLKVGDFGLARAAEGSGMTAMGTVVGTPAYVSPEQCQGGQIDGRSDIYSLGVVLYEVVVGRRPFEIKNMLDAVAQHVYAAPPAPRELRPDIPPELESIIMRCLAKSPLERFQSMGELSAALQQLVASGALDHLPLAPPDPAAYSVPQVQVMDANGALLSTFPLTGIDMKVGRAPGNQVVLNAEGVSRSHLRIDWDGGQVVITDIGTRNGTLIDGNRLEPHVPYFWSEGQALQIGTLWLYLVMPQLDALAAGAGALVDSGGAALTSGRSRVQRIDIAVEEGKSRLTLTPGQPVVFKVTVANLGHTVDHLSLEVEGVPEEWVRVTPAVQLKPEERGTLTLTVTVPPTPESRAGEYSVTLRARSRQNLAETKNAFVFWTVMPFVNVGLELAPKRARGRPQANFTVTLRNNGNLPVRFRLSASDDEQGLEYVFEQVQVNVDPGKTAKVKLQVSAPRRLIGSQQMHSFTVQGTPAGGDVQTATAQYIRMPLVSNQAAAAIGAGLMFTLFYLLGVVPGLTNTSPMCQRLPGCSALNPALTPTALPTPEPPTPTPEPPTPTPDPFALAPAPGDWRLALGSWGDWSQELTAGGRYG